MASHKPKPKTRQKKKTLAAEKGKPTEQAAAGASPSVFSMGDTVHHPMFGDGKVEGIEENKLTITFQGHVTKVIREDFVTRKR